MKNLSVYAGTTKAWNLAINGGSVVKLSDDLLENATVIKEGNGNAYLEHPVIDDIVVLVPGRYHSGSTDITCGVILDRFITCAKTGETFNTVDILSQFKWGISTTNGGRGYVVTFGCEGTVFKRRKLGIEDVLLAYAVNGKLEPVVSPAVRGNYNMDYCRKKVITTVFPDDMLYYVMELPQKADMKHYWDLLHDAMEKYKQDSVLADAVTVKLPRRINSIAPTDDEICDFLVAIAPYRKGTVKQCEKDISAKYADVVGYINYIASCAAPTLDERWKFEIVRDFLNGENDALSYLDTKDK